MKWWMHQGVHDVGLLGGRICGAEEGVVRTARAPSRACSVHAGKAWTVRRPKRTAALVRLRFALLCVALLAFAF